MVFYFPVYLEFHQVTVKGALNTAEDECESTTDKKNLKKVTLGLQPGVQKFLMKREHKSGNNGRKYNPEKKAAPFSSHCLSAGPAVLYEGWINAIDVFYILLILKMKL